MYECSCCTCCVCYDRLSSECVLVIRHAQHARDINIYVLFIICIAVICSVVLFRTNKMMTMMMMSSTHFPNRNRLGLCRFSAEWINTPLTTHNRSGHATITPCDIVRSCFHTIRRVQWNEASLSICYALLYKPADSLVKL